MRSLLSRNNENIVYLLLEFVMALVHVVAATVVLNRTNDDHAEAEWIIAYTRGCIVHLLILCWRFWQTHNHLGDIRIKVVMLRLETVVDTFFAGSFMVFFWVFVATFSSLDHTGQLEWLCVALLVTGCIRYLFTIVITCAVICLRVTAMFLLSVSKLLLRLEKLSNSL